MGGDRQEGSGDTIQCFNNFSLMIDEFLLINECYSPFEGG